MLSTFVPDKSLLQALISALAHLYPTGVRPKIYIVGGAVRDYFLGKPCKDVDIATSLPPEEVLKLHGRECISVINTKYEVVPTGIKHGTVTVVVTGASGQESFEITTLRADHDCDGRHAEVRYSEDILEDLARRDFTMNAIAYDIAHNRIVDPYAGANDCAAGLICCVGEPEKRFQEDYLRIIRAARFAGYSEKMHISELTIAAGKKLGPGILPHVSKERIRVEILKMMETPYPKKCIRAMLDMDILRYVLPCVNKCLSTPGGPHHGETVFEHLVGTMIHLPAERPLLRLVGLLHDVGKEPSCEVKPDGISFYNHEVLGARIAYEWAQEFKFSREECEYISLMVRHHMFHMESPQKHYSCSKCGWSKTIEEKLGT